MNRSWIPYFLVALGAALGGYGLHALRESRPLAARADTLNFESSPGSLQVPASATSATLRYAGSPAVRELPAAERAKIQGAGGLDSASYFDCLLTNSSRWTVTEVCFHIAAGQAEGSTRWERNYREFVHIPPDRAVRISFKVTNGQDAETRWNVIGARGIAPQ
jgi:hypothetical protein